MDWRFITAEKLNPEMLFQQDVSIFANGLSSKGMGRMTVIGMKDVSLVLFHCQTFLCPFRGREILHFSNGRVPKRSSPLIEIDQGALVCATCLNRCH
jgi:hypothetical protein